MHWDCRSNSKEFKQFQQSVWWQPGDLYDTWGLHHHTPANPRIPLQWLRLKTQHPYVNQHFQGLVTPPLHATPPDPPLPDTELKASHNHHTHAHHATSLHMHIRRRTITPPSPTTQEPRAAAYGSSTTPPTVHMQHRAASRFLQGNSSTPPGLHSMATQSSGKPAGSA